MRSKLFASYGNFLQSNMWLALRAKCVARDHHKCRGCAAAGVPLQAHHLFYRELWEMTKLEDLVSLCDDCHKMIHGLLEWELRRVHKQLKHHRLPFAAGLKLLAPVNPKNVKFYPGMYEGKKRDEVDAVVGTNPNHTFVKA